MAITQEDVFAAADSLESNGINPSVLSVRAHLGNTGSSTTILKYLREWKEARAAAPGSIQVSGPGDIEQDIRKLVAKAHRQGFEQGKYDARLAEEGIRAELTRTVFILDEATAEMERMEESLQTTQTERDGLVTKLDQANHDLAAAKDTISRQSTDISNLTAKMQSHEQRIEDLSALLTRAIAESDSAKAESQRLYDLLMRGAGSDKEKGGS